MAKFLPLSQAVADNLNSGDIVAFEGVMHRIPTAAAHEAIRQGFKDLTLVRMTPDLIYDQMIGMGMARKVTFSYAGNPGVGLLRRLRDAVENGFPHALEIEEHSHAAMANAYEAGAAGLPCAIFRGYRGAELARVNPNIRTVTCPFTGEVLAAVPSARPDVTFIHAQKANKKGDVLVEGIIGIQKRGSPCRQARRGHGRGSGRQFRRPAPQPDRAAELVGDGDLGRSRGAHPSYAHGYYVRDNASYLEWDEIAEDRGRFSEWMQTNVIEKSADDFAARVELLRNVHERTRLHPQ